MQKMYTKMYVCVYKRELGLFGHKNCSIIENKLIDSFLKKVRTSVVTEKTFNQIKHPLG